MENEKQWFMETLFKEGNFTYISSPFSSFQEAFDYALICSKYSGYQFAKKPLLRFMDGGVEYNKEHERKNAKSYV